MYFCTAKSKTSLSFPFYSVCVKFVVTNLEVNGSTRLQSLFWGSKDGQNQNLGDVEPVDVQNLKKSETCMLMKKAPI